MKVVNWIKNNKLSSVLLLGIVILYLTAQVGFFAPRYQYGDYSASGEDFGFSVGSVKPEMGRSLPSILPIPDQGIPPSDSPLRMVVAQTDLSLVVNDVRQAADAIAQKTETIGGFMVSRSLSQPEEAPYGYISLRVPAEKAEEAIGHFRGLAIKVVSENVSADDVTDQYEDIDKKLTTLEQTKLRLEEIMDQATEINDILSAQREIINLQNQIDSLIGRQEYLEKTAQFSLITIHLSTDELALPYQPTETFRPLVIFRQALRSMILTMRDFAGALIWLGVYGAIWIPVILAFIIFKYFYKKKK